MWNPHHGRGVEWKWQTSRKNCSSFVWAELKGWNQCFWVNGIVTRRWIFVTCPRAKWVWSGFETIWRMLSTNWVEGEKISFREKTMEQNTEWKSQNQINGTNLLIFAVKFGPPATILIFLVGKYIIDAREHRHPVTGTLSLYSKHLKSGSHLVYFQSFNFFLKIMRIYQSFFWRLFLMQFEFPKHNDYVGDQGNALFASHPQILVPCRQFVRMVAQSSEKQSEFGDNHAWNKATSGFNATRYHTHCLFLQNLPADFQVSDGLKIWVTKEANNIKTFSELADTPFPSLFSGRHLNWWARNHDPIMRARCLLARFSLKSIRWVKNT